MKVGVRCTVTIRDASDDERAVLRAAIAQFLHERGKRKIVSTTNMVACIPWGAHIWHTHPHMQN